MVTDLANEDLTNLQSDHLTTAFAQVALTAAKVFQTNAGITTPVSNISELIKNVTGIKIEFDELKKQVTDKDNPNFAKYEKTRKVVEVALKNSDTSAETEGQAGSSILEKLLSNDTEAINAIKEKLDGEEFTVFEESISWEEEITKAIDDGVIPEKEDNSDDPQPVPSDSADRIAVNAAVRTVFNAMVARYGGQNLNAAAIASLSAALDDQFLTRGIGKTEFLNLTPEENAPSISIVSFETFLTKIDDNTFKADVKTVISVNGVQETIDSRTDGYNFTGKAPTVFTASALMPEFQEFPTLVRKQTNGSWKVFGNQTRIDYLDMHIGYRRQVYNGNATTGTSIWLNAGDVSANRIVSATISGGNINGTLPLGKNPNETEWHLWDFSKTGNYKTSGYPFYSNTNNGLWPLTTSHTAGQVYTVTVNFANNITQTYKLTVPAVPTEIAPYGETDVTVSEANGKLKITWPKVSSNQNFSDYEVIVWNEQGQRLITAHFDDINKTSAEFPFSDSSEDGPYTLENGKTYNVNFGAFMGGGSFSRSYNGNYTVGGVVNNTSAALKSLSGALNGSLKSIGAAAPELPIPGLPAPTPSIRASGVDVAAFFPPGTKFYNIYSSYQSLENIFAISLNLAPEGIEHMLMRIYDASGNVLQYTGVAPQFLTGDPRGNGKMDIWAVYSNSTNGLNVNVELFTDKQPVITNVDVFTNLMSMNGKVELTNNSSNFSMDIQGDLTVEKTSGNYGIIKNTSTFECYNLKQNNQTIMVNNMHLFINNGLMDSNGVISADVRTNNDNKVVARLKRNGNKLELEMLDSNGDVASSEEIQ